MRMTAELAPQPLDLPVVDQAAELDELVAADLLVEDVSIDGMCGVY
jgi:mycofactocin precursor